MTRLSPLARRALAATPALGAAAAALAAAHHPGLALIAAVAATIAACTVLEELANR